MNEPKYFVVNNEGTQIPIQVLLPPKKPLRWAREYPVYCRSRIHKVMKAYTTFHCMLNYQYSIDFINWANIIFPVYTIHE